MLRLEAYYLLAVVDDIASLLYDWTRSTSIATNGAFDKHDQIGNAKVYHRDERITGAFLNHPVYAAQTDGWIS